jgi:hypothetical protein
VKYYEALPDDVVVVSELTITSFINTDGKTCYAITPKGNSGVVEMLGALELVKFQLLIHGFGSQ